MRGQGDLAGLLQRLAPKEIKAQERALARAQKRQGGPRGIVRWEGPNRPGTKWTKPPMGKRVRKRRAGHSVRRKGNC